MNVLQRRCVGACEGLGHQDRATLRQRFDAARGSKVMQVDVTMEDPGALASPWELHLTWRLAPGEEVLEYICNDNNVFFDNIEAP